MVDGFISDVQLAGFLTFDGSKETIDHVIGSLRMIQNWYVYERINLEILLRNGFG